MADAGSPRPSFAPRWPIRSNAPGRSRNYYFRTNPLFETGAQQYAWLNDIVCVGTGYLVEGGIAYKVAQVI